jgi:prefoldin subunit 5
MSMSAPVGIPRAPFAEDPSLLISPGDTLEMTLQRIAELTSKYRMMEGNLEIKRDRAQARLVELERGIDAIDMIQGHPSDQVEFEYELADTLYAHALITDKSRVGIYLGANVIMECSGKEAVEMLSEKAKEMKRVMKETEDILFFLREQITTCEVSQARLYNVAMRQRRQGGEGAVSN